MYYINKLYELGQLSFKTTDPSIIIDDEYYSRFYKLERC